MRTNNGQVCVCERENTWERKRKTCERERAFTWYDQIIYMTWLICIYMTWLICIYMTSLIWTTFTFTNLIMWHSYLKAEDMREGESTYMTWLICIYMMSTSLIWTAFKLTNLIMWHIYTTSLIWTTFKFTNLIMWRIHIWFSHMAERWGAGVEYHFQEI